MKLTKAWVRQHPKRLLVIGLVLCLGGSAGIYWRYATGSKKDAVMKEIAARLPREGLIEGSLERIVYPQVFGYAEFTCLCTAAYMKNGKRVNVYFNKCSSISEAKSLAKKYHGFVSLNGGSAVEKDTSGFELPVLELYGVTEVVFTKDQFVCGVHESEHRDEAVWVAGLLKTSFNRETSWWEKLIP